MKKKITKNTNLQKNEKNVKSTKSTLLFEFNVYTPIISLVLKYCLENIFFEIIIFSTQKCKNAKRRIL